MGAAQVGGRNGMRARSSSAQLARQCGAGQYGAAQVGAAQVGAAAAQIRTRDPSDRAIVGELAITIGSIASHCASVLGCSRTWTPRGGSMKTIRKASRSIYGVLE